MQSRRKHFGRKTKMEWIRTEGLSKTYGSGENTVQALSNVKI